MAHLSEFTDKDLLEEIFRRNKERFIRYSEGEGKMAIQDKVADIVTDACLEYVADMYQGPVVPSERAAMRIIEELFSSDELHESDPLEDLVNRFAEALFEKLRAAEVKYGYNNAWQRPDWMDTCRAELRRHVEKGDPRDVAAYCAFLWHHGARTTGENPSMDGALERAIINDPEISFAAAVRQWKEEMGAKRKGNCGACWQCLKGIKGVGGMPVTSQRMIVCPECGNKRCPKATELSEEKPVAWEVREENWGRRFVVWTAWEAEAFAEQNPASGREYTVTPLYGAPVRQEAEGERARAGAYLDSLRRKFRAAGLSRGWSFEWPERSGYAHGELHELVEAVRGKAGDIRDEAGDALLTGLCGLVPENVPMVDVLAAADAKTSRIASRDCGVDGAGIVVNTSDENP